MTRQSPESHQMMTRQSPDSHQTVTRHPPDIHQTVTRQSPDSHAIRQPSDSYQIVIRHLLDSHQTFINFKKLFWYYFWIILPAERLFQPNESYVSNLCCCRQVVQTRKTRLPSSAKRMFPIRQYQQTISTGKTKENTYRLSVNFMHNSGNQGS
jgi:hypothetical protein